MTARHLLFVAFAIALAIQAAAMLTLGPLTDWCFCAITQLDSPPLPPPYVQRFIQMAFAPDEWAPRGLGLPLVFAYNLAAWFLAVLVVLHGMALAARLRVGGDGRGAYVRLAAPERVRAWQMLLLACALTGVGAWAGAMARDRWLSEAEQVFYAAMSAASTGRPLPPGVGFSMVERRGREDVQVNPGPRFSVDVDPHLAGDHFLDRFVVPFRYGGWVRFPSGPRFEFTVWPERLTGGWNVDLYDENLFSRDRRHRG
ncbi:MAG TPA: hypothetical protein VFT45_22410 [Longimicrobium sp.]|nr:hypothetical protein [Longimicrobium sp.]